LEAVLLPDNQRVLNLYGKPGAAYALQTSSDLGDPSSWLVWRRVPLLDYQATVPPPAVVAPRAFYRARELTGDPPLLEAALAPDGTGVLTLYGQPGGHYRLESTTHLTLVSTWQPVDNYTLTRSFVWIEGLTVANPPVFYRVVKP